MIAAFMAVSVKSENFSGINADGEIVKYSGTATVISKDSCCGNIEIVYVNEYRSFPTDTIVEVVKENTNYFVKYLIPGDKMDFCVTPDCDLMVKRVRFFGKEHMYFDEDILGYGESEILRINQDGSCCLENGLIITRPLCRHNVGDVVYYKTSYGDYPLAKELNRRAR